MGHITNVFVFGIIVLAVLGGSVFFKISGNSILDGATTGQAISNGDLEGLEVSVVVPEKYQNVMAGEMLQFQISLKNIESSGRQDIQLDYYIKKNDIIISHRRELKAVETQASFLSSIKVSEETLPGIYNIEVVINEEESALATFYVKSSELGQVRNYLIILIVAIVLVGGMISWQLGRLARKKR